MPLVPFTGELDALTDGPARLVPFTGELDAEQQAPSMLDRVIGSAPGSVALGMADLVTGPLQLGANVGSRILEKFDPEKAKLFNLGEFVNEKMAELNAASKRGRKTHGREGIDALRILGGIGAGLSGQAGRQIVRGLPEATSWLGKTAQGIGQGAIFGETSAPTESTAKSTSDYLDAQNEKGLIGATIGGAIPGVVYPAMKGLYNLAAPHLPGGIDRTASKTLREAAGDRLDAIRLALLSRQPDHVTASQAASEANRAEFSALGEAARKIRPSEYADIASSAEAANRGLIERHIAGKAQDLPDALAHRESVSKALFGQAYKAPPIAIDTELSTLLSRPSMRKAVGEAEKLAREKSSKLIIGETTPSQVVRERITTPSGKIIGTRPGEKMAPSSSAEIPVESLHFIKKGLDDVINRASGEEGLAPNMKRAAADTKKDYLEWLYEQSPEYAKAAESHIDNSMPINQMKYGRYLLDKLRTPGNIGENAPAFLKARQDQASTIESALGGPWYTKESDFIDPVQSLALNTVNERLMLGAKDRDLAQQGASSLRGIVAENTTPERVPNLLYRPLAAAHYVLDRLQGAAGKKTMERVAKAMQNPEDALALIGSTNPKTEKVKKALIEKMLTTSGTVGAPKLLGGD